MNLLTDTWIPVLYENGAHAVIAPHELTVQKEGKRIVKLNIFRPDFNGALIQFLIGLLQTALPELTDKQWRLWRKTPPTSEQLKEIFLPMAPYFNLFGEGPCFMQDFDALKGSPSKPVAALLIEQPGEQTLSKNADHFIKRDQVQQLCLSCAATALFTLQTNAPSGGQGHRTSMRGGGPLTSIVTDDGGDKSLWHTLWLNVLSKSEFKQYTNLTFTDFNYDHIFPWSKPTFTSENDKKVRPSEAHLFQMYWGMPRRIRLNITENENKSCGLCGHVSQQIVTEYTTKNYGVSYSEDWRHTLSPYRSNKDNQFFPMHPQPGGIGYQHWLALTLENNPLTEKPATVVVANHKRLLDRQQAEGDAGGHIIIWAFGYDMDNMQARCWYENQMPFYAIAVERVETVRLLIRQFIDVTQQARLYLSQALSNCKVPLDAARQTIWQKTEAKFYTYLDKIVKVDEDEILEKIKLEWLKYIQKETLGIFESLANVNHVESNNIKTHIKEKKKMIRNLHGKKIYGILNLTKEKVSDE